MEVRKIGIMGAGTMGAGIAQVCAQAGLDVVLRDIEDKFVQKGLASIDKSLSKAVEKLKITAEQKSAALAHIKGTTNLADVKDCDLVIEAIIENAAVKKTLLKELGAICKDGAIIATNTSTISITDLASAVKHPANFAGMHFFNPVPMMKLVEVIKGVNTGAETVAALKALSEKLGKTPVEVKDSPGFVVNRALIPMINEAIFCFHEGVASAQDIDNAMKLGANHPMGPLELADLIGLDVVLAIMDVLHESFKSDKYRACPLLREMVSAKKLGRKTGKGFYDYEKKP
ncbi:MAG: 3-hydroxybutyryl-CoA dehydrogenase [Candidatus Thermoplasmatota archaeon]|nr:3-hydroxybutyryl-CoA dehydrogenase [Candidatus Thermoplasmatota archaeon]